ncbi:plastocyanin/azurin family copper-binding protein [Haloarchaeobius sp. DFWS5]|uniref:plastocyanin/azurin family copper-binding protein n=1 Tax=Haloarchaeobius sp. DFWS5 TaxID=3446114 RepID=UPI003EBDCB2A
MRERTDPAATRRDFLRLLGGTSALALASTTTAQEGTTHTVDMTDSLVFDPDDLIIAPGDTVRWITVGNVGHTVTAYEDAIPDAAAYFASGDFSSESNARNNYPRGSVEKGETYTHTFTELGSYEYFCIPHENVGMVAKLEVREGGAPAEEPATSLLPDSALAIGAAMVSAMLAVLGLVYVFIHFGGNYEGEDDEGRRGAV